MQVHYDEGIANRIGPEPCAGIREDVGEASAGERAGQPLSRDRKLIPGADAVCVAEGNMSKSANASAWTTRRGRRTWHARTLFAREPGDLMVGQQYSALYCSGPHWEGEEPKPMVYDYEKSDSAIVARKPTNKVERSAAEPVEPRAKAKGNASQQSTHRAQYRVRVTQALARIRRLVAVDTRGGSRMREIRSYGSVRGALSNERPLYVANCSANKHFLLNSEENGEPLASLGE